MTSREQRRCAAARRDATRAARGSPDAPCMGRRRRHGPRPWVVELRFPPNTPNWILWRDCHDGHWHPTGPGYSSEAGARSAALHERRYYAGLALMFRGTAQPEVRIRNTETGEKQCT